MAGKQTKKSGSKFGGLWTKQKLLIIEEYLNCYSVGLKNTKVHKIYIDAFAGSGITELEHQEPKNETFFDVYPDLGCNEIAEPSLIEGSALISLKYNFDEYYFLELDEGRIAMLEKNIKEKFPEKLDQIHIIKGDSNETLEKVLTNLRPIDRCLMFLDPYAMELNWDTLKRISEGVGNDVWYLFPLHALTRILPKDRSKLNKNEILVTKLLGTNDWESTLYEESKQMNLFGDIVKNRISFNRLQPFIIQKLKSIFPYVSDKVTLLKNTKDSPMFLLCFMMTNTSERAQKLAQKFVDGIKKNVEKIYE